MLTQPSAGSETLIPAAIPSSWLQRTKIHWQSLTSDQRTAIILIILFSLVILLCWNTPILQNVFYPFKIVTVMAHEMGHALTVVITGGKVVSISVNANEGGLTTFLGGNRYLVLPAGYVGSSLFGSFLLFCGFDQKRFTLVGGFVLEVLMSVALYWASNWFARIYMIIFIIGIGLTWYYGGGAKLSYLVLFMGCNSALYSVFDIIGDLISRRVEESDAYQLSLLYCHSSTLCPPELLGVFWLIFSVLCMTAAVMLGVRVFRKVPTSTPPTPSQGSTESLEGGDWTHPVTTSRGLNVRPLTPSALTTNYASLNDDRFELEDIFTRPK